MCVCVYECVCVCMSVCVCMFVSVCVCAYVQAATPYVHGWVCACLCNQLFCGCMRVWVSNHTLCFSVYVRACVCVCVCECVCLCVCVCE